MEPTYTISSPGAFGSGEPKSCHCEDRLHHHHHWIFYYHAGTETIFTTVGPLPGNLLAACMADLTPDLQVCLS